MDVLIGRGKNCPSRRYIRIGTRIDCHRSTLETVVVVDLVHKARIAVRDEVVRLGKAATGDGYAGAGEYIVDDRAGGRAWRADEGDRTVPAVVDCRVVDDIECLRRIARTLFGISNHGRMVERLCALLNEIPYNV